jgi:MSHA biogenesis protein MshQ
MRKLFLTGMVLFWTASSFAQDPLPVAKYHLDESTWNGTFNEVKDVSGNNLHGTAVNGALTANSTPAIPSINNLGTCGYGSFEHDNNQYVNIADNNILDLNETLTVSAWINPSSGPSSGLFSIFSKDSNFEVHIDSSRRVFWWWQEDNGTTRTLTSSVAVPLNAWSFITIRYDFQNSRASLFINGVLRASRNSGSSRRLRVNGSAFQIGQDQNFPGRAFDGSIDEVQIFDAALTDQQIQQLYSQRHDCSIIFSPQCFTDDFSSSPLSDLWVTSTSKGSFQPQIINNRLRFTQAVRNQATSSTYQRLFPAADNLVEIEFDHFAYGGNGADGIAIVLSDALITPRAGAFGGPLGYGFKRNEPGFAGGWLGVGIDEYGNFSREGGQGNRPGRRRQSVAIRGSGVDETGYRYLAGACNNGQTNTNGNCLSPRVDNNSSGPVHRYRIVVDSRSANQSQVEILRKIGSGSWQPIVGPVNVLSSQFNQAAVPADFLLSVTGSTGGSTNIHEIDNFEVCALRSRPIDEQIDHFRITHTGQGVTCNRSEVTIQACKNATCSELFTDTVTVSLDPSTVSGGGGWEGGNSQSFTGGSGTFYIRKYQPGTITLDVMGSNPPARPFSTNLCQIGSGGWSASNCDLVFSDSGFEIDVPDKYAAEAVEVTISAVKQGDSNTKCDVGFGNVTKSVALWSQYLNPTAVDIIGDPKVSVDPNGTYIELNTSESGAGNFNLAFDSNGQTKFNLNYDDAGQMQLNAKFTGTVDEAGLELSGASNFVSFPASLAVVAKNSDGVEEECTSIDAFCAWFTKAGASFNLEVTALGQTNQPTPNYTHSGIVVAHELASPDTATSQEGTISTVSYDHSAVAGSINIVSQSLSEVGVFDFTITPPAVFNGSSAKTITPAKSVYLRFIPAYFAASVFQSPTLQATCNSFSYIGQPFDYLLAPRLALNPKAANGADVTNYQFGDFWRYDSSWPTRTYSDTNTTESINFEQGVASVGRFTDPNNATVVQLSNEQITYTKGVSPINSFSANLQLTLGASDITDQDNVCYKTADSNSTNDCLGISFNSDNAMQLYWGRLLLNDTYGSELSALRQRLELQYYNSNQFVTNTADSCTNFDSVTNFDFSSSDYTVVTSGSPTQPEVNASLTSATASNGESWLEYSAPGSGNTGTITSSFNMQLRGVPWLREDADNDGSLDDDNSVSGQVQFGTYRGSDRVIWWSEQD